MSSDNQQLIKELAQAMEDTTFETFIHQSTLKLIKIPTDELRDSLDPEEFNSTYGPVVDEYEKNELDYIDVPFPDSAENYKLMKSFVNTITDTSIKSRLAIILGEAKPFKNFKHAIESKNDLNDNWISFKSSYYIQKAERFLNDEIG